MHRLIGLGWWVLVLAGCTTGPYVAVPAAAPAMLGNPALVPVRDQQMAWELTVDVIDDYFRIQREIPVQLVGNVLTEGRLETFPEVGATVLEPWRRDSVTSYERLESTLQSIQRRAIVRVIPAERGFLVEVNVFKELEDLPQPVQSFAADATFRYDNSLTRIVNPVGEVEATAGWIPLGRDMALEQEIIIQLLARSGALPVR